jgi:UDP-N-acetylmuramoyl-tripeptide--D-alanyl-D-alanine ligase
MYNAVLGTMATLQAIGEHPFEYFKVFNTTQTLPGRMKIISGIKDTVIIDDSYNSSFVGLEEALECIKNIDAPRKLLALGDMLELGRFSVSAHKSLALDVQFADVLVCVGVRARLLGEEAIALGLDKEKVFFESDSEHAGMLLQNNIESGDLIFVKGSQNMRMEKTVFEIMSQPDKKEKLLVRQEEKWWGR